MVSFISFHIIFIVSTHTHTHTHNRKSFLLLVLPSSHKMSINCEELGSSSEERVKFNIYAESQHKFQLCLSLSTEKLDIN
jgi:AAA+ superfamily predicted ATPase